MRTHPLVPPFARPLIIAHRGASSVAPENTLAAFSEALLAGADGFELDVRLSRDGVPVVIHDSTLRRTGGLERRVSELSSAQLARVDVGSWFNRSRPKLSRQEFSFQTVPSLAEVFALTKKSRTPGGLPLLIYVEIKTEASGSARDLIESVLGLASDYNLHSQVIIVSFDLKSVALVKNLNAAIRTGALFSPRTRVPRRKRQMINAAIDCSADEVLIHRLLGTRRAIELLRENNLAPVVWTVDHASWVRRASTTGIRALITNTPSKLISAGDIRRS